MSQHTQPATGRQLAYLRALAHQTGTTFISPRDRREASREIERLRRHSEQHGSHLERNSVGREPAYATAAHASEIDGWGASARWRTTTPRETRQPAADKPSEATADGARPEPASASPATRLVSYRRDSAEDMREVVAVDLCDGTLVIDRIADIHDDARLVARLDADEPPENAQILTGLYLADPSRGRCRAFLPDDLAMASHGQSAHRASGDRWETPLVAGIGVIVQLQVHATDRGPGAVRWTMSTETDARADVQPVSLRRVIGQLQDYEPAMSLTAAALRAHEQQPAPRADEHARSQYHCRRPARRRERAE